MRQYQQTRGPFLEAVEEQWLQRPAVSKAERLSSYTSTRALFTDHHGEMHRQSSGFKSNLFLVAPCVDPLPFLLQIDLIIDGVGEPVREESFARKCMFSAFLG